MQVRTGYARTGDSDDRSRSTTRTWATPTILPVLLIMGLGAQLLLWRKGFCEKLVDQGLRVIRYDNRDVGLSSKVTGRHTGAKLLPRMVRSFLGRRSPAVYTLEDLADDAAALLDHLGIDTCAHRRRVDGRHDRADLRGQVPPAHQDARHIFSSNNRALLPPPGPRQLRALLQRPADSPQEAIIANAVRVARIIGSPASPVPEEQLRADALEGYDRALLPGGHRAATSPRCWAAAACCATTARSPRRPS